MSPGVSRSCVSLPLLPYFHSNTRLRRDGGSLLIQTAFRFRIMRSGTQVSQNDQLVLKLVGTLQNVIQMHVAELVNLFFAMFGTEKRHLCNQHFSCKCVRVRFKTSR